MKGITMAHKEFIDIGKGMFRAIVRSKAKRDRLARIPGVQISGSRVIFPAWAAAGIRRILFPPEKRKTAPAEQLKLFDDTK
jgi:hypothetical protein